MRIWVFTLAFWRDAAMAEAYKSGLLGLPAWEERVRFCFSPTKLFMASGTWSDPKLNPMPHIELVNAGVTYDAPYEGHYRSYPKCAFTAAMAFALNRRDEWDILIQLDTDCLIGDVDLDWLIREFWNRSELMCCAQTNCSHAKNPEGPLTLWKAEGAVRLLHYRQVPNLLDPDEKRRETWDQELGYIYRGGRWWNLWPDVPDVVHKGCDRGEVNWEEMLAWPMVVKPTTAFAQRWIERNSCKTKPFKP